MLAAPDLLAFLTRRGGQEFRVSAVLHVGQGKKATVRQLGEYRLTARGGAVQATGPSGQTRQLSQAEFAQVFGTYAFTMPEPTGQYTDLGPLFGT